MADLKNIFGMVMMFSFLSIIFIFVAVLYIGVTNDYILYNLQGSVDTLGNLSIIGNNTVSYTQALGDSYSSYNFYIDEVWFAIYFIFVITSFVAAYQVKSSNYFSFLFNLFYGTMFILAVLTLFTTITNWFKEEVLLMILPSVTLALPKFYWYLENVGILSAVQIVICLIINMIDFDFSKIFARKKQEQNALEDEEIV